MISSYDIVGDIAIIEIPKDSDVSKETFLREIRKTHPRIKTILEKIGERKGTHRLRRFRKLFGKETETVHKEHGFRFRLDPTKVFFSPRDVTERQRIASQVKTGETVLVMFAGVGPYGIVIAGKKPKVGKVYQVEINPAGFRYMKQNIAMNKLSHKVIPIKGDVREACKPLKGRCDRVVTPLAKHAYLFLDVALACLNPRGIIHFYYVGRHASGVKGRQAEKELFGEAVERLERAAKKSRRSVRILKKTRVLPYSPGSWKICIDARVD
jgi:tRNA (guanine37-N1)-methyltransferase